MFNDSDIATLRALMEYEAQRSAPPAAFPELPDIPGGRYTDPRFYELEQQYLWRKSWLLASHMDEVPEPGSYRLWDTAGQPVLIVHGEDGEVRAFYNTCRHRGAPIVTESFGRRDRLVCPYHGWTYRHDGELIGIRDAEDFAGLDRSCYGLIGIRCERFGKLIFVNFDDDAVPLLEWLGPIAEEWREFQFDRCRLAARHIFDLDCNWKVAMEANTEVYHVPNIHRNTLAPVLDDRRNVNTLYANGHGRMIAPSRLPPAERDRYMQRSGPEIDSVGEIARSCTQSYNLFPNWVSPLSARAIPPLLFWPNGINRCRLETWTIAPDWGDGPRPDQWTVNDGEELIEILQEDTQFSALIQQSLESYGFRGIRVGYQEARIYHWNQWADRLIGVENIPPELRVEQVIDDGWLYPNDPRLAELNEAGAALAAGEATSQSGGHHG